MKKCLLLLLLISFGATAQTLNNYKYVIVPVKFNFLDKDNKYRLNTLTKMHLNDLGFRAFYDNEQLPDDVDKDRCGFLYVSLEDDKTFLSTKIFMTFKDCKNNLVYKSESGSSKKKEYDKSYQEALQNVINSIQYRYEGSLQTNNTANTTTNPVTQADPVKMPVAVPLSGKLKAEVTASGYLIIDEESSRIALKLYKTSDPKIFIASRQAIQGVLIQKANEWFFDYYQNDKLISEKINVTF